MDSLKWRDIMQSVGMWGSSISSVHSLPYPSQKIFVVNFVLKEKFTSLVMAPANREDELNISLESASIQTTLAPTLDPMVVLATRNCLWTWDLVSYGHFA